MDLYDLNIDKFIVNYLCILWDWKQVVNKENYKSIKNVSFLISDTS
jgi:hypothetical protein